MTTLTIHLIMSRWCGHQIVIYEVRVHYGNMKVVYTLNPLFSSELVER
jgi:hypothetical protein